MWTVLPRKSASLGKSSPTSTFDRRAAFGSTSAKVVEKYVDRKETLLLAKGKGEGQMNFLRMWHR